MQRTPNTQHVITITDVSDAPEVNFTTTAQGSGVTETASAAATINFTDYIRLSSISGKDLWFSYATDDDPGTATSAQDYTPVSGSFKIDAGSLAPATTLALPILSDDVDELDQQTVRVTIDVLGADQDNDNSSYEATSNAETATEGSMVYTYTIDDDDDPPHAFFKNEDGVLGTESGSVDEGDTKTITVALSSVSERDVVLYRSDAGTGNATSGTDYTAITAYTKLTTISGTPGGVGAMTEVSFDVVTSEDLIDEDNQTIVISLLSTASVTSDMDVISYATAGGGSDAQAVKSYELTITDDDALPMVNFTDGSDNLLDGEVTAENGGAYTVNVELTTATEKTVTIPFTFSTHATVPATRANATGDYPVDFYYSGFTGGGSLTINGDGTDAGPKATFDIVIMADAIDEWNEKIVIDLGEPTNGQKGGTSQYTITITDASASPAIAFTTFTLDNGNAEATQATDDYNLKDIIALSTQSGKDLTFSIKTDFSGNTATATAAQDYTELNTTFTLTAGQTAPAGNIILDILDDAYDEVDEQTVEVQIGYLGADIEGDGTYDDPADDPGATAASNVTFTYHINDDEAPPVLILPLTHTMWMKVRQIPLW